jgi:ribose transport system substrate-binding protein
MGCLLGLAAAHCRGSHGSGATAQVKECTALPPLAQKATYTIGFVPIYEPTNPWGITNTSEMIAQAAKRGYKLVYEPLVNGDAAEQAARVHALVDAKVDAIILRPMDASALALPVVEARKACVPVFTENRFVDPAKAVPGTDYVTGIGADPVLQGQAIANWLIKATSGKATVIEIEGTTGSSSAIGRKRGFDEQVVTQAGMKIVASESGSFTRQAGHDVAKRLLAQFPAATVVYSHGDIMTLGALEAAKELGKTPGKDLMFVSIDGLKEAVQHVLNGTIAAIEFNDPRFGAISFDTIEKYAAGQVVPSKIIVKGPVIDSTNASTMISEAF